jgi:hypothetical protein
MTFSRNLQHTAGLLVDESSDALDTTSSEKSNSGLGDDMDVVSQNLFVSLFTSLANHLFLLFPWPAIVIVIGLLDTEAHLTTSWQKYYIPGIRVINTVSFKGSVIEILTRIREIL